MLKLLAAAEADVREAIRSIIDDAMNSAIAEPWEVAAHATDRILSVLGAKPTVAIRPLEWEEDDKGHWEALSLTGHYHHIIANSAENPTSFTMRLSWSSRMNDGIFDSLNEAKAAAQAAQDACIRSALTDALSKAEEPAVAVKPGWRMVPERITSEMEDAHFRAHAEAQTVFAEPQSVWAYMLAAAPVAPSEKETGR